MANSEEYKSRVGLDSLYVAIVTADSAAAYTAGTPAYLAPAAEASQEPSSSLDTQYADDQPFDVLSSEGPTKISLKVTNIDVETLALITGRVFDAGTGRMFDNGGTPPFCALSFRSLKSNGKYRYYQYLKGRFDMPKEDGVTKREKAEPQALELTFTAIPTIYQFDLGSINGTVKRVVGDEDTTNFSGTGWFSQVQTPVATSPSALALSSSVPTDGATGVSVSADQSLTFNNTMVDATIYAVSLIKASDGSIIAGSITLDSTKKIVTINPTSSLSASTAYIIAYNVTDVYGQHLQGAVNFTTA